MQALIAAVIVVAVTAAIAHATCPLRYRLTDIGDLGGGSTVPFGLNGNGAVVGLSDDAERTSRAFRWTRATGMRNLVPDGGPSVAIDVNDADRIILVRTRGKREEAVLRSLKDGPRSIVLPTFGGPLTQPFAINDRGRVVGWSQDPEGAVKAFRWLPGQPRPQDLGSLPTDGQSIALDISETGLIVGISLGDRSRAFLWSPATRIMVSLPRAGFAGSAANGVNAAGEIVGLVEDDDGNRSAVLWPTAGARPRLLGTLARESVANGVNHAGVVVGWSSVPEAGNPEIPRHAIVWTAACGLRDLNDLVSAPAGILLGEGVAINRAGEIAVQGRRDGVPRGYLLTPLSLTAGN
jgi:probable HAF family extracellular repeat protein